MAGSNPRPPGFCDRREVTGGCGTPTVKHDGFDGALHAAPSNAATTHAYDRLHARVPDGTCHTPDASVPVNAIRVPSVAYSANWYCNDAFGCPSSVPAAISSGVSVDTVPF